MKTKSIKVTVLPSGQVQIEALGFTGAACEKATRFIEEALGWQTSHRRKPEYFQANQAKGKNRQRLGGAES